ncbi:MAG TPA: carbohydrate binding domain-containing protein [Clostridia bacterium]|nr:carbohydrate binding domain-containing protein [Clostridia bacterium]
MVAKEQKYTENGVKVSKTTIYAGDKITVSYFGLLVQSGANDVYLHFGFGDEWESKDLVQMNLEYGIFKADIKVEKPGTLNIAFKDSAENWDNNSAQNYSFKVSKKAAAKEAKKETKPVKKETKTVKKEVKTVKKETAPKKKTTGK